MGNIFCATCRATMLHCKLRWFVARITTFCATNFHVAESKSDLYFLQQKFVAQKGVNTCNKPSQLAMQEELML